MCLDKILVFFKPKPAPLDLPHPEEPQDLNATLENTDIKQVVAKWLTDWEVPENYWSFWLGIDIKLDPTLSNPAATFAETKQTYVNPMWANSGIIAHEMAHISYSLLSEEQKTEFSTIYISLKTTDLSFLYSQKPYGLINDVEGHADCYRYLGSQLPDVLKKCYPRLF